MIKKILFSISFVSLVVISSAKPMEIENPLNNTDIVNYAILYTNYFRHVAITNDLSGSGAGKAFASYDWHFVERWFEGQVEDLYTASLTDAKKQINEEAEKESRELTDAEKLDILYALTRERAHSLGVGMEYPSNWKSTGKPGWCFVSDTVSFFQTNKDIEINEALYTLQKMYILLMSQVRIPMLSEDDKVFHAGLVKNLLSGEKTEIEIYRQFVQYYQPELEF